MQDLWFIAVVPPGKIIEKLEEHRQYAAANFGASHALKTTPHLTLFPPFRIPERVIRDIEPLLGGFFGRYSSFDIQVRDFGSFPPRVIFFAVERNSALNQLQNALDHLLRHQFRLIKGRETRSFHPHITVAHRDLDRKDFPKAWKHYSDVRFALDFPLRHVVLFRHDGKYWQDYRVYNFA